MKQKTLLLFTAILTLLVMGMVIFALLINEGSAHVSVTPTSHMYT